MHVFLSYNQAEEETARRLGVHLNLVGVDVWFDEWEIHAGDSIPGKLNEGLATFDTFILLWSKNAERSSWVRSELESAIQRGIKERNVRIIPLKLDATELPTLLQPLKWIDLSSTSIPEVVREIMGFSNERDRIRAIQDVLESAQIEVDYFHGYGAIVGCPQCGAGLGAIEAWSATDYERYDQYAGARCRECGWDGGGEV